MSTWTDVFLLGIQDSCVSGRILYLFAGECESMLDPGTLAKMVASLLTPVIPFLLKGGDQAWTEASKKIGPDAWEWAKSVWGKLISRSNAKESNLESTPDIVKAATEVASHPSDEDAQAALRYQIKKLLSEDSELILEVERSLKKTRQTSFDQNIRVGGVDISGSSMVANSGNIVGGNQENQ